MPIFSWVKRNFQIKKPKFKSKMVTRIPHFNFLGKTCIFVTNDRFSASPFSFIIVVSEDGEFIETD